MITVDSSAQVQAEHLISMLTAQADPVFAAGMQRYFPHEITALGVANHAVVQVAKDYFAERPDVPADLRVRMAQEVLARAGHHEEVLLGFALLHKVARRGLGDDFLSLCRQWLEQYVTNWAQCDDMCLKLLYPYFLGHLDQIPRTRDWVHSPSNWARRAANVSVLKFTRRAVGGEVYELPLEHIFGNCTELMRDADYYVQKGSGWLLKVTGQVHPTEVADFVTRWRLDMKRDTFRYAVESLEPRTRARLMALDRAGEA